MNHITQNSVRPDGYLLEITRSYSDELPPQFLEQSANEQYKSRAKALGRTANTLSQNNTVGEFVTPEAAVYSLIGKLDTFFEGAQNLDAIAQDREEYGLQTSRKMILAEKMKVIDFNHTLRDVIDKHPRMSAPELVQFMAQSYSFLHGSQHIDEFVHQARARVIGMQHELLTEQVIGTIDDPDISYELASPDEETRGIDIKVTVGDTVLPLDIKASQRLVDKAIERGAKQNRMLVSPLSYEEAKGRFRLPREEAVERAKPMRRQLLAIAYQESENAA